MNKKKIILSLGAIALLVTLSTQTVFASEVNLTPAGILSKITGKSIESLTEERKETNKSYGAMAKEEGIFDDFKEEMIEVKKARINELLENNEITKEEADKMISSFNDCDGTGKQGKDGNMGMKFGKGNGNKQHGRRHYQN